jgi:ABC-type Fe3+-hydroxamate transport system substrate-binding protein
MSSAEQAQGETPRAYTSSIESPVDHPPQRVVSLVPSLTEALFDLDLGERLIAITDYCIHPADRVQGLPRVGAPYNPDLGQIIDMQPDLVLMDEEDNTWKDADSLQAAGIPIWVTEPRTVFDTLNVLWSLMDIFDHPVMIPRVREIERAYDYTLGASQAQTPTRVFAPLGRSPWWTFNAETYAHDLLRVCGAENVFGGKDERYPGVTPDEIVAAQPEVVLLPGGPLYPFSDQEADMFQQLDLPPERIIVIDRTLLTFHGTRIAYALRDLPGLFLKETE